MDPDAYRSTFIYNFQNTALDQMDGVTSKTAPVSHADAGYDNYNYNYYYYVGTKSDLRQITPSIYPCISLSRIRFPSSSLEFVPTFFSNINK